MLARLDKDVLSKKPQWMTLSCGVNDVWHGPRGVPLDDAMAKSGTYDDKVATRGTYKKNITAIIDQATAAGREAGDAHRDGDSRESRQQREWPARALQRLPPPAREGEKVPMADLNAMFQERIKAENKPNVKVLTSDGVHMNAEGNKLMAIGVLKAFGLNEAELDKAKASWPALEAAAVEFAKKQAEARAKAAAEKAKGKTTPKKK
jgi:lysophospholipase L1-like esterase